MDAITIERARRNDRAAQAELLRAMQDVWFRVCRGMLNDIDVARDATQETAVRFLRELPHFEGQSSISTWSIGIAINVAREMRRATLRGSDAEVHLERGRVSPAARGPSEIVQLSEEVSAVRAVLDELPERQRAAIVLRFFENMTVEETATVMGCAPGTVKATVHQALRAIRRRLERVT